MPRGAPLGHSQWYARSNTLGPSQAPRSSGTREVCRSRSTSPPPTRGTGPASGGVKRASRDSTLAGSAFVCFHGRCVPAIAGRMVQPMPGSPRPQGVKLRGPCGRHAQYGTWVIRPHALVLLPPPVPFQCRVRGNHWAVRTCEWRHTASGNAVCSPAETVVTEMLANGGRLRPAARGGPIASSSCAPHGRPRAARPSLSAADRAWLALYNADRRRAATGRDLTLGGNVRWESSPFFRLPQTLMENFRELWKSCSQPMGPPPVSNAEGLAAPRPRCNLSQAHPAGVPHSPLLPATGRCHRDH